MKSLKKLVVLSGAGMSAESGIATFRGSGGLWEGCKVEEVATPEAFHANPELVLNFYNARRENVLQTKPNLGHITLAQLEENFDVHIVTQNVDDLHERAGSTKVLHLHGELMKSRSTKDESLIFDIEGSELNLGDLCPLGSQLRPHIVWFGEAVPMINKASKLVANADVIVIVGTSMQVYPAAGLVNFVRPGVPIHFIDPNPPEFFMQNLTIHAMGAVDGLKNLAEKLLNK
ncbi:MAG: NAD-dependent protein deacylase [Crocinitomicaceae bacterium]|nr:NAD-dependent protein deacylase [Crocinitomicaceae bacterium]